MSKGSIAGYSSRRAVSRAFTERVASFAALDRRFFLAAVRLRVDRRGVVPDLTGAPCFFFITTPLIWVIVLRETKGPERPPAEQMHVQVVDLLAPIRIALMISPITALCDTLGARRDRAPR